MRTHIPSRLLVLTAVGVGLIGAGAAGSSQAADPFVAGHGAEIDRLGPVTGTVIDSRQAMVVDVDHKVMRTED